MRTLSLAVLCLLLGTQSFLAAEQKTIAVINATPYQIFEFNVWPELEPTFLTTPFSEMSADNGMISGTLDVGQAVLVNVPKDTCRFLVTGNTPTGGLFAEMVDACAGQGTVVFTSLKPV